MVDRTQTPKVQTTAVEKMDRQRRSFGMERSWCGGNVDGGIVRLVVLVGVAGSVLVGMDGEGD